MYTGIPTITMQDYLSKMFTPPPFFRWYHEGITRHVAESLLTAKSVPDGTYLLRDSLQGGNESLTLSVR